jgi:hypothetical protein
MKRWPGVQAPAEERSVEVKCVFLSVYDKWAQGHVLYPAHKCLTRGERDLFRQLKK